MQDALPVDQQTVSKNWSADVNHANHSLNVILSLSPEGKNITPLRQLSDASALMTFISSNYIQAGDRLIALKIHNYSHLQVHVLEMQRHEEESTTSLYSVHLNQRLKATK